MNIKLKNGDINTINITNYDGSKNTDLITKIDIRMRNNEPVIAVCEIEIQDLQLQADTEYIYCDSKGNKYKRIK